MDRYSYDNDPCIHMGITPPEPEAELEFDTDDNLGCFRAVALCLKVTTAVILFVWIIVEGCKQL